MSASLSPTYATSSQPSLPRAASSPPSVRPSRSSSARYGPPPCESLALAEQPLVNGGVALAIGARQLERHVLAGDLVRRGVDVRDTTRRDEAPDRVSTIDEGPWLESLGFHDPRGEASTGRYHMLPG